MESPTARCGVANALPSRRLLSYADRRGPEAFSVNASPRTTHRHLAKVKLSRHYTSSVRTQQKERAVSWNIAHCI